MRHWSGALPAKTSSVLVPCEHVARSAHRQYPLGLLGIVLDGGADAADVDVDRAVERLELFALQEIHQRIARQHAAGALGERQQECELIGGERAFLAVEPDGPRILVVLQSAAA